MFVSFIIFLEAGARRAEREESRERGRLMLPSFSFVDIVILGSDFVPILGVGKGLIFFLISSLLSSALRLSAPPKAEDQLGGSGDSNPCSPASCSASHEEHTLRVILKQSAYRVAELVKQL